MVLKAAQLPTWHHKTIKTILLLCTWMYSMCC